MIAADQPDVFPDDLLVAVSSRDDGTMLDRSRDIHDLEIVRNRRRFCERAGIDYEKIAYQIIQYGPNETFDIIHDVDRPTSGIHADILYTETPQVALFLPLADCVGTVIYDPKRRALALAHLGRHSSIAKSVKKAIQHFIENGSDPGDLLIWMAPSVAASDYVMEYFDHLDDPDWHGFATSVEGTIQLDLQGFNARLAEQAGVVRGHISISPVNTARDTHYFSHSQGDVSGRFALVAMMC